MLLSINNFVVSKWRSASTGKYVYYTQTYELYCRLYFCLITVVNEFLFTREKKFDIFFTLINARRTMKYIRAT